MYYYINCSVCVIYNNTYIYICIIIYYTYTKVYVYIYIHICEKPQISCIEGQVVILWATSEYRDHDSKPVTHDYCLSRQRQSKALWEVWELLDP